MKHKIVLDVDGVLLNFVDAFEQVALSMEQELNTKIVVNRTLYNLADRLGVTAEQEKLIWDRFAKNGTWENLNPLPGVVDAIEKINNANFEIHIVTAIEDFYKEQRLLNLSKIGVDPSAIHCVGYGNSKTQYINEIAPDVFIDDRLEHLHKAPITFHLVWLKDEVEQHGMVEDAGVHVAVNSLQEWVENYMPAVVDKLNIAKNTNTPLQRELKFI